MIQWRPGEDIRMTATEIRDKYENFARWYDPGVWLSEVLVVRRLRRKLLKQARGHVLEVAVGTGANLEYYPRGIRLTAIDISPSMLERAQQKAKRLKLDADFHVADIESFAPPGQSFDTIVSSMATCTFPDPVVSLEAMSRLCKPNGRILMIEHGRSSNRALSAIQDRFAGYHVHALACHWNREPRELIDEAGLAIVSERHSFFGVFHAFEVKPSA